MSPTEFVLKKVVREQAVIGIEYPTIVSMATICLCQPLSSALVERGASALKRVKTRLRSRLGNDVLSSLMHISCNGPKMGTENTKMILLEAAREWRATHVKNLPPIKLPKVGGAGHGVIEFNRGQVSTATQVNLSETGTVHFIFSFHFYFTVYFLQSIFYHVLYFPTLALKQGLMTIFLMRQ